MSAPEIDLNRYDGMTVSERLFDAGLLHEHKRILATGDEVALNRLLAKVGLRYENGMHWSLWKTHAQN